MNADAAARNLALYYFDSCPFCVMVMRTAKQLGVELDLRDIMSNDQHRKDLSQARGRTTVPVLRITDGAKDQWMPESRDIMRYLEEHYG